MAENENLNTGIDEVVQDGSTDYIEAIKSLKATTVSKDEYNKLVEEKKQLVQALINGEEPEKAPAKPDTNALKEKLARNGGEMNNLEYVRTVCDLRDAILEEKGEDIFVPKSSQYTPTDDDYQTAEKVARIYRECIDYAGNDSQLFTNELMRRTVNDSPITSRPRK